MNPTTTSVIQLNLVSYVIALSFLAKPDCQSPKPDMKEIPLAKFWSRFWGVFPSFSKGSWKNHWKLALFPCFALILVHSTGQVCHCRARATSSAVWIQVINRSCHSRSFRPLKKHRAGNSLVNGCRLKSRHDIQIAMLCACLFLDSCQHQWLVAVDDGDKDV